MSKLWGAIGSWAAEAEAEELEQAAAASKTNADLKSFPSLKDAINSKPKKKKIPLSEFISGGSTNTPSEMFQLPTGPQQRSSDDYYSGNRLGGGSDNYGRRDADAVSSWGGGRRSQGGFDDDSRGPSWRDPDYDLQPSRADEANDWGAGKKSYPVSAMESGRNNQYGSSEGGSRADDVESWNFGKKRTVAPPPAKSNTFSSGHRDSATDSNGGRRGGEEIEKDNSQSVRQRLVLDPRKGDGSVTESAVANTSKPNLFGSARPREDVLIEKGLDWKKIDMEIEAKKTVSSRPSSDHSSRSENTGLGQAKPKVNPFGDAKPREVVLQEKGKDWRKIDLELELRAIDRPETEEERVLKEEIDRLKKELPSDPSQEKVSEVDQTSITDLIQVKEKELEALIRELDDKVRFAQKSVDRPGSSGAGRYGSLSDNRPPSQSGSVDDSRSLDFADRPCSRGHADVWTRPGEDRRGSFHGGRGRGFRSSRDFDRNDRPAIRGRW